MSNTKWFAERAILCLSPTEDLTGRVVQTPRLTAFLAAVFDAEQRFLSICNSNGNLYCEEFGSISYSLFVRSECFCCVCVVTKLLLRRCWMVVLLLCTVMHFVNLKN